MITLTLENAYAEGCVGAFLRAYGEAGNELATGLWDVWYTASAEDEDGNWYTVYWATAEDYDPAEADEGHACDWDKPYMVIDEHLRNVTELVTLGTAQSPRLHALDGHANESL